MDEKRIISLEKQISDERAKLSSDRMDISFGEIMNIYSTNELIIRPEYQRLFRWSNTQKTALIESILMGIPIPPIFVAEDEDGVWELVDGLQRVSTILSFFGNLRIEMSDHHSQEEGDLIEEAEEVEEVENSNNWVLDAGSLIKELEGFDSKTLPKKYLLNIKRAVCRVEILRGKSNTSMKYELFKRLNSGGSKLTAQEIRNAIYRGIDPTINELIEELSQDEKFISLTTLSKQKTQQLYDQELVLRFIAFYNNASNINSNTENFLDTFMANAVETHDFDTSKFRDLFTDVITLLKNLNDEKVFRNDRNTFVPALYEGIMIGTSQHIEYYKENTEELADKINELKKDSEFKRLSGTASNSKSRVKRRLLRVEELFSNING